MLLEPRERVVGQHLGPQVGVVTGRVAVAPDVLEVAGTVARRHVAEVDVVLLQRVGLERVGVLQRGVGAQRVPVHVEQRGRDQLGHVVALVEVAGLLDLVDQRLRHRLAGLVVLGVVGEHLRIGRPVLVELRRELDEVARRVGARQRRVLLVGEHAVQRVAELVEHGDHVVERQQRRLAGGRLGEVGDVVDHRLGAEQLRLVDEVVHPGAAALVVALEVVAVEQRQRVAVLVEHLEHAHVRLVHRNVLALLEGQPVELVGGVEHAVLQHVVELEVRLDLVLVEVVLRLAHLLGVELPVPRLQLEACFSAFWSLSISAWMSFASRLARPRDGRHQLAA